jgi:hypothetical protein
MKKKGSIGKYGQRIKRTKLEASMYLKKKTRVSGCYFYLDESIGCKWSIGSLI